MRRLILAAAAAVLVSSGCSNVQMGGAKKKVVLKDFAEGRVVQVAVTDRLTGAKEMLFVSMPKKSLFLEGYIQGLVVDYDDSPIQGVVVRAVAKGESQFVEKGEAAFQTSSFDAGVSDSNGIYRIRFSLPILKNLIDIRGELLYNPGWEQERDNLGKAYRPQAERSPFRLHFDMKEGMLIFSEGVQKIIVAGVESGKGVKGKARVLPGAQPAAAEKQTEKPQAEEDLFKGFGFQ